jgi:translocator protein
MPFSPMQKQLVGLAGWLAVSFAAAALGGFASANAGDFYQQLTCPPWAPPTWLFAPAWTLLYLLMGVVAWLVCRERGFRQARTALSLFLIQLAVNALWIWLFFVWRQGGWRLVRFSCFGYSFSARLSLSVACVPSPELC